MMTDNELTKPATLARRNLGRTDIQVTPIGLGGAWLGYQPGTHQRDHELGAATVLKALELGIRLIDTSGGYGDSEEIIGKGLREWFRRGGQRDELVISSKTGTRMRPKDYSGDATRRSVEQTLKSLGTDYIDVMMVHDPETLDPVFAPHGALEALQQLNAQGIVRAIGLGVRSHDFHRRCIESGQFDMSLTYGDYNLLNRSANDLIDLAVQHEVGIFNAMVVEYGLLSGADPLMLASQRRLDPAKVQRAHALWQWAQAHEVNLLSVAIQFSTRDTRIASTLVGAATPAEIESDMQAYSATLSDELWADLLRF